MLILTRRPGETLIIETPTGERITVTVLDIKGHQATIGTAAPRAGPDDMGLRVALPGVSQGHAGATISNYRRVGGATVGVHHQAKGYCHARTHPPPRRIDHYRITHR